MTNDQVDSDDENDRLWGLPARLTKWKALEELRDTVNKIPKY